MLRSANDPLERSPTSRKLPYLERTRDHDKRPDFQTSSPKSEILPSVEAEAYESPYIHGPYRQISARAIRDDDDGLLSQSLQELRPNIGRVSPTMGQVQYRPARLEHREPIRVLDASLQEVRRPQVFDGEYGRPTASGEERLFPVREPMALVQSRPDSFCSQSRVSHVPLQDSSRISSAVPIDTSLRPHNGTTGSVRVGSPDRGFAHHGIRAVPAHTRGESSYVHSNQPHLNSGPSQNQGLAMNGSLLRKEHVIINYVPHRATPVFGQSSLIGRQQPLQPDLGGPFSRKEQIIVDHVPRRAAPVTGQLGSVDRQQPLRSYENMHHPAYAGPGPGRSSHIAEPYGVGPREEQPGFATARHQPPSNIVLLKEGVQRFVQVSLGRFRTDECISEPRCPLQARPGNQNDPTIVPLYIHNPAEIPHNGQHGRDPSHEYIVID